jgi:hypothetical protein
MLKKEKYTFLINSTALFALVASIFGCAAMQTPDGGPKDTDPPKVLKISPSNLTTNFKSKKVTIDFDEYIKLNNEFKEFSISPETEKIPELKIKGRSLEITLPDSLETNTTYTLNFGRSIVDLNESNELKNFSYVFATGPVLDSLSISGNVTNALTGDPEIDALVMAIPASRDSIFGVKRASIYTLSDSSGNFKLNNLRKDNYKLYALKEKNGDKIYQQLSDEVGFLKDPVQLDKDVDSVRLTIFKELAPTFRILDKKLNQDGSILITFNKQLKQPEIKVLGANLNATKQYLFTKNKDSVSLWLNDLSFDSTGVEITDKGKVLDTVKFTRGKRDTYNRIVTPSDNLENGELNPFKPLTLTFNLPVKSLDESKIILLEDSIPRKIEIVKDSLNFLKYHIIYKWRAKENYILELKENAVTTIFDAKNKEIIKKFKLGDANNYGTLALTVETPDSSKFYVLEVVDKDKKPLISFPIKTKTVITLKNYKQGIYYARVAYDENKNGVWDTGNVKEGLQPESLWYEPKELSIRANWDRAETIKIPLIPPLPAIKQSVVPDIKPEALKSAPNKPSGKNAKKI